MNTFHYTVWICFSSSLGTIEQWYDYHNKQQSTEPKQQQER